MSVVISYSDVIQFLGLYLNLRRLGNQIGEGGTDLCAKRLVIM